MSKWSSMIIIALLLAILYQVTMARRTSGFAARDPGPIVTEQRTPGRPASIFDLKTDVECTPGPSEKAAYYTSGLSPGGLCGDGDYVRDELRDFAISDGIGGSLLEK